MPMVSGLTKENVGLVKQAIKRFTVIKFIDIANHALFVFKDPIEKIELVYEDFGRHPIMGFRQDRGYNCAIWYKKKLYYEQHELTPLVESLPKIKSSKSPEFQINDILGQSSVKIVSKELTQIRNFFRFLGLLPENRGKTKKKKLPRNLQLFLLRKVKKLTPHGGRLPMAKLQSALGGEINRLYPNDPQTIDKYDVAPNTIRRLLKPSKKK